VPWNPDRYQRALAFAARAHAEQKFPGTELPYLLHVVDVCQEALRACLEDPALDADLVMHCAFLHDTLEDTDASGEEIEKLFGAGVLAGVRSLSKNPELPKAEAMNDSLRRICEQPREVAAVKLSDRIVNLQEPPHYWDVAKRQKYQAEARTILAELAGRCAYLEARLAEKIERYAGFF
jgi:(p)ppGpp synthase/HD superfamily hydrolase